MRPVERGERVEQRRHGAAGDHPHGEPPLDQAGHLAHRLAGRPHFEPERPLPTLISGDIALTATPPKDGAGARAQVVRRQPDGSWLRLLDQPEFAATTQS
jgi:hypothetical protein